MLLRLFLLFTLVPVAELALLVAVGSRIGVLTTVAIVVGTGVAGAWLARAQGLRALRRVQGALAAGQFPGDELLDGVLILAGGLLLLTPGFLTDVLGLCALLPGSRHLLKAYLKNRLRHRLRPGRVRATSFTVS